MVALDHMEIIRGIQAKFYVATHAEVSLYSPENEHREECEIIMENGLMTAYKGYRKMMHEQKEINPDNWMNYGTGMTGIVFLSEEDAKEMFTMIQDFLASHKKKEAGTSPWEYGIVTYKTKA